MSTDDISMGYSIDRLPTRLPRSEVIRTLMDAARYRSELPPGWAVTWMWRNSKRQPMREADFSKAVRESRAGFVHLILRRLSRDAGVPQPTMREATPAEIAAIEATEEETDERRVKPGQATRQRAARRTRKVATVRRVGRRRDVVWRTRDGRFTEPPTNSTVRRRRETAALMKRKRRTK